MKFTIDKSILFKSLSHVQSIVEKKNTLPILSNILLEAKQNNLVLSATDMDISITEKINCNVIEEGSTTVTAHTLYDIIRKLPDSSNIDIISNDGKIMSLRAVNSKFSLGCLPKEDLPIIVIEDLDNEIIQPLYEDINTPGYIANLHKLYEKANNAENKEVFITACKFIGLLNESSEDWFNYKKNKVSISENEILNKIESRNNARKNKNYKEADKIRDELLDKGVLIEDKNGKTNWKFK